MTLAEFGVGQVLWSIFWFFLFLMFISLVITIFGDIIRSGDLSGWAKAGWALLVLVLPFFGVFIYLIVRGSSMGQRHAGRGPAIHEAYLSTEPGARM